MKLLPLSLALTLIATGVLAKPPTCRSWQKMEVPYLGDVTLETIGGATTNSRGRAIITLNPDILQTFPPLARDFWLAHSCGHHALIPDYNTEKEADCYAMKLLRKKKVRTPEQMETLLEELRSLPEDAWGEHRPDEARINALRTCGQE